MGRAKPQVWETIDHHKVCISFPPVPAFLGWKMLHLQLFPTAQVIRGHLIDGAINSLTPRLCCALLAQRGLVGDK